MSKWLQRLRIPVAVILLLVGVFMLLTNPTKQYLVKDYTEEAKTELKTLTPEEVKASEDAPATYNYEDVSSVSLSSIIEVKRSPAKVPMIGEIAVPELGINLPITKGISDQNLLYGAATMKPNQKMGVGNYTLASHYSDAYNETLLFSPLIKAKAGMSVYLTDMTHIYHYKVTSVTEVEPTAVEVLDETGENIITLVTCNDLSASKRRIVRGKLTNIMTIENAPDNVKRAFEAEFKTY